MKLHAALFLLFISTSVEGYSFVPSRWGSSLKTKPIHDATISQKRNSMIMKDGGKELFTLSSMFGKKSTKSDSNPIEKLRKGEPHPSVRPHISPLNRLTPKGNNNQYLRSSLGNSEPLPMHPKVRSGQLSNGLPYIILPNKSPPGRFEVHLQVFSGSGMYYICFKTMLNTFDVNYLTPL
jgi:hypothetical protein